MFGQSLRIMLCAVSGLGFLAASLVACTNPSSTDDDAGMGGVASVGGVLQDRSDHLPLRIPISAVMTGAINRSSNDIFRAAMSVEELSDKDWLGVGAAAVDLVGAASLITIAGTGSQDAEWTANPEWARLAADMQSAGLAVGSAASTRDHAALTGATARLAQSCQSCHMKFSPRLLTSTPTAR